MRSGFIQHNTVTESYDVSLTIIFKVGSNFIQKLSHRNG